MYTENPLQSRHSSGYDNHRAISFDTQDLSRLSTASRLNDVCINDCASLLQRLFDGPHSDECAILSTFALASHRDASDDAKIWRTTKIARYWLKTKWIIPIHCPGAEHWVLCVVDIVSRHIDFFDSLAEERHWLRDIKVCSMIIFVFSTPHVFPAGCDVPRLEIGKHCSSQWSFIGHDGDWMDCLSDLGRYNFVVNKDCPLITT